MIIDIKGNRYGLLTVIGDSGARTGNGGVIWLCRCDCGQIIAVSSDSLRFNHKHHCGCEAAFNKLYYKYSLSARRRGISFKISRSVFRRFTSSPCYYCGVFPEYITKSGQGAYTYNGIDRIDPSRGYKKDNLVTCCYKCNMAKGSMTQKQFIDWVIQSGTYHQNTGWN